MNGKQPVRCSITCRTVTRAIMLGFLALLTQTVVGHGIGGTPTLLTLHPDRQV